MTRYRLTFITPLFSKGSYDNVPEVRPPSIRGQLHWWFRALGGSHFDEKAIFGGVHGGAVASKVVVRVNNVSGQTGEVATLPHKSGGHASPKWAYKSGTSCDLHVCHRLGGLNDGLKKSFDRTLETWLLLGSLGLRATRAAGSFCFQSLESEGFAYPDSLEDYRIRCGHLLKGAPLKFYLIDDPFDDAEALRRIASDTIGGRDDYQGEDSLSRIYHPLGGIGKAVDGRKTSPLRFRILKIGKAFHIAAIWDNRTSVTGNREDHLKRAAELLADKGKEIGRLLLKSL